jgi:GNAT superfamily N-acetyltransferase
MHVYYLMIYIYIYDLSDPSLDLVGKFSALAVPPLHEGRGIGRGLVQAAEQCLQAVAAELQSLGSSSSRVKARLEMGVINLRQDLFPWYEGQGFVQGGPLPVDEGLRRILLDGQDVWLVLMTKDILL